MKSFIRQALSLGSLALVFAPQIAFAHGLSEGVTKSALVEPAQIVDCTLTDGSAAQCTRLVVSYLPDDLEIGPFCPATIDEEGGIWEWTGENAGLYRVNKEYFQMLDRLGYRFYDDDGTVHIADIAKAQPVDDHACINVALDETVTMTMLIPVNPVMAEEPTPLGVVSKVGVALDGVPIFSDAPSIQHTGHMPALDTCGGHVDPGGWYHWHATSTDIETVFKKENVAADCALPQDSSAKFGYAFDGYAIYGSTDPDGSTPTDLDACRGHVGVTEEGHEAAYHYHATDEFPNLPKCLVGLVAQDNFKTTAQAGIGAEPDPDTEITRNEPPRPGNGMGQLPPGFEEAAHKLDVSVEELMKALDGSRGQRPDLKAAAARLGVSEERLRAVLPPPPPGR
ncbi:YHYH protein [Sneathiella litorea]|uniref:YHYH protein n=1 Tax=Sneathiella litorea TaxID=2606216 RepID=A0A6L8WA73_9PROT|nr:YHYH protein [Sneathiella litorea]MZR31951.1 YHYH protein [Sneathiella litorea]